MAFTLFLKMTLIVMDIITKLFLLLCAYGAYKTKNLCAVIFWCTLLALVWTSNPVR